MEGRKKIGFFLGPVLFILILISPILRDNLRAHMLLAVFFFVVVWWVTECIPIPITALLIPVFLTLFRIAPAEKAFSPFANPIIMLFLGSFILARAMSVHSLDRKLAFSILSLKSVSSRKTSILFAFCLISAFLSLWISNTATTAMIYPIALGVLGSLPPEKNNRKSLFGPLLLLAVAYSASVGGIGTPIGSPPNLIAIGMLDKLAAFRITFFQWMLISSLALVPMFFALFFYMKFRLRYEENAVTLSSASAGGILFSEKKYNQPLSRAQKNVLTAFAVTVFLWILPGAVSLIMGREASLSIRLQEHVPESIAAVIGAGLLFLLPVDFRRGEFTLSLADGLKIDWGTLLLFGGGLSLGFQMFETGLAGAIGNFFLSIGGDSTGLSLITLLAVVLSVYLTEVTSNTACASMIIPIIIAITQAAGLNPVPPVLGSALGCSFAFMLPVATPPNAIIYGSRLVALPQMIRCGFWLNILGILIIWTAVGFLAPFLGLV